MTALDRRTFARPVPPMRTRALPWITVVAGSLIATLPVIAAIPLLPPFGLMMLLGWRLVARNALPRWAAAPLGFADDLVSGQPLGSAVLLWSLALLALDVVEQQLHVRDFWQDWLIASGVIACCLLAARYLALPVTAAVDPLVWLQIGVSILLFPATARLVALVDRKREPA